VAHGAGAKRQGRVQDKEHPVAERGRACRQLRALHSARGAELLRRLEPGRPCRRPAAECAHGACRRRGAQGRRGGPAQGPVARRAPGRLSGRLPRRPGRARRVQAELRAADQCPDRRAAAVARRRDRRRAPGHGPHARGLGHQPGPPDRPRRIVDPPRARRRGRARGARHLAAQCPAHHAARAPGRPRAGRPGHRRGAGGPRCTLAHRPLDHPRRLPGGVRHRRDRRQPRDPLAPPADPDQDTAA
jgi:hypothetical protein